MEENVQRKSYANVTNKVEKDLLHFRNTMQNIAEVHNNISWQKYFTIFIFSRDFSIGGWFLGQLHLGKLPLTTKLTLIITLTGGQLSSRGIVRIPVVCLPSKFTKSRFHHRRRNMFQCNMDEKNSGYGHLVRSVSDSRNLLLFASKPLAIVRKFLKSVCFRKDYWQKICNNQRHIRNSIKNQSWRFLRK